MMHDFFGVCGFKLLTSILILAVLTQNCLYDKNLSHWVSQICLENWQNFTKEVIGMGD